MNKDETKGVLGILKMAYPTFYKDLKKEDAEGLVNLWASMFEDDHAKVVTESVKALMCTLKFPPTIADIKEKISLITQPKQDSEMEAWATVRAAISYYGATDNFNNLDPILQKLIGSPNQLREWAQMESSVVDSVIQSNFMRSYTAKVKSEKELRALPESTKELIQGLAQKFLSA